MRLAEGCNSPLGEISTFIRYILTYQLKGLSIVFNSRLRGESRGSDSSFPV